MKRRDFLKHAGCTVLAVCAAPYLNWAKSLRTDPHKPVHTNWRYLGGESRAWSVRRKELEYDVAVIGGGMAGICAAVAAARQGSRTVLIQDRPVLGGNASSEIQVTVIGAQEMSGKFHTDRETGIIEELLLANRYYNPQDSYTMWDYVLYDILVQEPNLTLLLNTQAQHALMEGERIRSAVCWQATSETEITVTAQIFIDASGDGMLAADAGAEFRTGREGKAEFGEVYAPDLPDGWVMGDSLLVVSRQMPYPVPFRAPGYAIKYDGDRAVDREITNLKEGFWWLELGSPDDIIGEREEIAHQLKARFWGIWDYIKNSGKFPNAANLVVDWLGSLPGRRESRRFVGDYILSSTDMLAYRHFDDAVAYGGWSLDEHCPGGILSLDQSPSFFHVYFDHIYEIPYRCLYSRNVSNLLLAGRNVSVSHMALSSTRVMGTCALLGQAVGMAAAMCIEKGILPRTIAQEHVPELQERMLREDFYIPNRPAADPADLARKARITADGTHAGMVERLVDGVARDEIDAEHYWESDGLNALLTLEWPRPVDVSSVEVKCDTNLQRQIMMHKDKRKNRNQVAGMPPEMVRAMSVEVWRDGDWHTVGGIDENLRRLIRIRFATERVRRLRIRLKDTYGAPHVRLYEVRCYA